MPQAGIIQAAGDEERNVTKNTVWKEKVMKAEAMRFVVSTIGGLLQVLATKVITWLISVVE